MRDDRHYAISLSGEYLMFIREVLREILYRDNGNERQKIAQEIIESIDCQTEFDDTMHGYGTWI